MLSSNISERVICMAGKIISVNVRLTQKASEGIKALADINGATVSEYIRSMIDAELEKNEAFLNDYQEKLQELRAKMKKAK